MIEGVDESKLIIKRKLFVKKEVGLAYSDKKIATAKASGMAKSKVAIIKRIVVIKAAKIPSWPSIEIKVLGVPRAINPLIIIVPKIQTIKTITILKERIISVNMKTE